LNLAKRTVSDANTTPPASAETKSSIFGGARPIDTATREREIEEKRVQAVKEKKEQDDKAREEKRAKEAAAKAEKASTEGGKTDAEEIEAGSPQPGRNFEVLNDLGDDEEKEGSPNGIVEDKAVKPKETVASAEGAGGSWRRKPSGGGPTAENLEDDFFCIVPNRNKNNRRGGNPGARAIAS